MTARPASPTNPVACGEADLKQNYPRLQGVRCYMICNAVLIIVDCFRVRGLLPLLCTQCARFRMSDLQGHESQ